MEVWNEVINGWQAYAGIFFLMFTSFMIGYSSAWSFQKNKYSKLLKNLSKSTKAEMPKKAFKKPVKQEQEPAAKKDEKDIDVIFTEIKPKIIEVVKEAQEEIKPEPPVVVGEIPVPEIKEEPSLKTEQEVAGSARAAYLNYTKKKPELNFDHIGIANASSKEDLTRINGIGPYIEQKLNAIGIFNYEQISRLEEADIRVLTELIDFFPGRIERDDWVGQSKLLNRQKQRS